MTVRAKVAKAGVKSFELRSHLSARSSEQRAEREAAAATSTPNPTT